MYRCLALCLLTGAGCGSASEPKPVAQARTGTLDVRPRVDTSVVVTHRPQLVAAPCTTSARDGEPAALSDPYQYVLSGVSFVHTSIVLIRFEPTASALARARVLRRIRGCVVGQEKEEDWLYVRIPRDTSVNRQWALSESLTETPTVDIVMPIVLDNAICAIDGPREQCTENARREQLEDWRRSYSRRTVH